MNKAFKICVAELSSKNEFHGNKGLSRQSMFKKP